MHIEQVVGQGAESVYVFHYPSQTKHLEDYPCKVGRAAGDVRSRIRQYQAGMQEEPVIDLVIKCDDSVRLERYLHAHLSDKKMPDTHGNEWYMTTPDGVLQLFWEEQSLTDLPIHDQVRRARALLGMTQAQLADAADVSASQVSALEQGFDVKVSTLVEVARELKLKVALVSI